MLRFMAATTLIICLLAIAPIRFRSTTDAEAPTTTSTTKVARSFVSSRSVPGNPLFDSESLQLTDDIVQRLSGSQYSSLFRFGDDNSADSDYHFHEHRQSGVCKVFPGDESWPSQSAWNAFNITLGGALITTVPLAAPCYRNWGIYNVQKCKAIRDNYTQPYVHETDPTSTMWPIFQGRTCLPTENPDNSTCTLGGSPAYTINISNVAQVQLAVNFARNANIRLVIKNTGHDYLGKSNGAGSLSAWTHNLKDISFLPAFESAEYSGPAMKIGAGVTVKEVYQAAHNSGVTALGGICPTVGYAGGYIAGGGHTPMSGLYGMAADHVMALEVVTADGRFITASSTSNPDLYWALRGGGGSTFGIVTSVITRVHPKMPITVSTFTFETSSNVSTERVWSGVRAYFELFIPFTDAGTYSFFWVFSRNGSYTFDMRPFFAPNHTVDSFNQLVQPWFDRLAGLGIPVAPNTRAYDAFLPAYEATWDQSDSLSAVGSASTLPGNRLFPRSLWEDPVKFNRTFEVIKKGCEAGRSLAGYHQAPRNRANVDNAVSSAFRNAISYLIGAVLLPENADSAQIRTGSRELTDEVLGPWRKVASVSEGGGSYLNEADVMEPNWQESFYGTKYARLLELKRKWDPAGVFYATTAVGSEEWVVKDGDQGVQTQNGRLCRV